MNSSIKLLLLTFMTMILFTTISITNPSFAKDDDDDDDDDDDNSFSDKNMIQICCAWGYELADGLLTYSIDSDDDLQDAVRNAVDSWNGGLSGITLVETDDNEDLKISFKNDGK